MTTRCIRCGTVIQGMAQMCDDCAAQQAEASGFPRAAQPPSQTWGAQAATQPAPAAPTACPSCGSMLPSGAAFCGVCGSNVPGVTPGTCGNCGATLTPGVQFCANCGQATALAGAQYAGFWMRFAAWLIDTFILFVVGFTVGLVLGDSPAVSLLAGLIGMAYTIGFWIAEGATPGKMALGVRIISDNGDPISGGQAVGRYFAQILSALILGIGFFMIGWTKKKQGLHDMLAGTVVIKTR